MHDSGIFIDWLTISQVYAEEIPVFASGFTVQFDAAGDEIFASARPQSIEGSFSSKILIKSDGHRLVVSGNPGRFSRPDNLFNFDMGGTILAINRILQAHGLPHFTTGERVPQSNDWTGARIHRIDLTCNYSAGNVPDARAFIRWLSQQAKKRISKGSHGDESVWWANTSEMLKFYIKHLEMEAHGVDLASPVYQFAKDNAIVRCELELKRRLLQKLGLNWLGEITMEKLVHIFKERTEIMHRNDASGDPDILEHLPHQVRTSAAAWLKGVDLKATLSRATFFRHAKLLREYGIDISAPRDNVKAFPVKVREISIQPVQAPAWYWDHSKRAA